MITITIACPAAMIADANQLARVLGYGPEDDQTYGAASWQDAGGNLYAVASGPVGEEFPAAAASPLVSPPWDADMAAAARAQALIRVWTEDQPITASPDHIAVVIGDDARAALAVLGVTQVPEEDEA
ncbi:hypothetical protein IQ03_04980 [Gemmobacter caeni]|uniref:Uncharacterized protein n=1 Tax=Gemmobacter caeni TaxID=589035 RepID=A0A2T6A6F0_9RHOB|nr:hypothetical protein [Gemmobacter caeni]PTX39410.1 hypothetical protein C8N34_13813 [Gemmobacter caeni]TWI90016.1 hypothetical protein IQ03_04980 [Gemmobacter caeni]